MVNGDISWDTMGYFMGLGHDRSIMIHRCWDRKITGARDPVVPFVDFWAPTWSSWKKWETPRDPRVNRGLTDYRVLNHLETQGATESFPPKRKVEAPKWFDHQQVRWIYPKQISLASERSVVFAHISRHQDLCQRKKTGEPGTMWSFPNIGGSPSHHPFEWYSPS